MKAHLVLHAWLTTQGQPYGEGVALAGEHGAGQALLQLLGAGANPFTRKKLRAFLQERYDVLSAEQGPTPRKAAPTATAPATAAVATSAAPAPVPAPVPAELAELRKERTAGHKLGSDLRTQLRLLPRDVQHNAARFELAKRIKAIYKRNSELWELDDYFTRHGRLPAAPPPATVDENDLRAVENRVRTLRTYVSGKRGSAAKQAAWQAELRHLTQLLNHG